MRQWLLLPAIAMLAILGLAVPARAAEPALVIGVFEIGGKMVPLPEGEWQLVTEEAIPAENSPALVALRGAVLVRRDAGEVTAVVVIHTNTEPLAKSLPAPPECRRGDIYLAQMLYETKTDGACMWANHLLGGAPAAGADPVWRQAAAGLAAPLPSTWLMAGFWISDRQDVLDIRYHFAAPVADRAPAVSWRDSTWAPGRIVPRGAHDVAVRDLLAWIGAMAPLDQFGFYRRLAGYRPIAMPWGKGAVSGSPLKRLRVDQLQALRAAGTIDAVVYAAQRDVLERDAEPPEPTEGDIPTRAFWKSLTRGAAGTLDTFVIGYLFFGSPLTATTYTIAQGIAHNTLYYFYEVAWQKVALQSDKRAVWKVPPIGADS
jgi:uncharacterized membrane protein